MRMPANFAMPRSAQWGWTGLAGFCSLLGIGVALQAPQLVQDLGARYSMMALEMLALSYPVLLSACALLGAMGVYRQHRHANDATVLIVAGGLVAILAATMVLSLALQRSSLDNIGMFGWSRLNYIHRVEQTLRATVPHALDNPQNKPLQVALQSGNAHEVREAFELFRHVLWGPRYARIMRAARNAGLHDDPDYQQALHRGWIEPEQVQRLHKSTLQRPYRRMKNGEVHYESFDTLDALSSREFR